MYRLAEARHLYAEHFSKKLPRKQLFQSLDQYLQETTGRLKNKHQIVMKSKLNLEQIDKDGFLYKYSVY